MSRPRLSGRLREVLQASAGGRHYPLVVALIAFVATTTFSFPFALVLVPAVLIAPRRWLTLGLLSGLASGLGGALLVELFNYFGREVVLSHFPELVASESWQWASDWLGSHGLLALLLVAASPMPQTPVILLYSLADPSIPGALLAIGIGKAVKYGFLAWLCSRHPARFARYR